VILRSFLFSLRARDQPERLADLELDLSRRFAVFLQIGPRRLPTLTDAIVAVGVPRSRLLDQPVLDSEVEKLTRA